MIKSSRKNLYYVVAFILIISIAIFIWGKKLNQDEVTQLVKAFGIWGPIIYIFIVSLTYIIAPLSGTPFLLTGYVLFDDLVILYIYLAYLIGAFVNFWLARIWGRRLVEKLIGSSDMKKIDHFTVNYGVKMLIFLRALQGQFADYVSFAYGLTNIRFDLYYLISILAPIPWLLTWYFVILKYVDNISDFTVWFVITFIPFWVISIFVFNKMRKNNN